MIASVFVLIICGVAAAFFLTWIFLALVGLIFVPVSIAILAWLGTPFLTAIGQTLIGYATLQISFGLAGWGFDSARARRTPSERVAGRAALRPVQDRTGSVIDRSTDAGSGSADAHAMNIAAPLGSSASEATAADLRGTAPRLRFVKRRHEGASSQPWPLFGGVLPLAAFYDPPCHADGRGWDGVHDPGYRTTILVFGWMNRAVSVRIGSPKPHRPAVQRRERDDAVAAMDERVRRARARSAEQSDERPPEAR